MNKDYLDQKQLWQLHKQALLHSLQDAADCQRAIWHCHALLGIINAELQQLLQLQ
jgi:hypothetical protein